MSEVVSKRDVEAAWAMTIRHRDTIHDIADRIEDDGDRCYFGSTNDADELRAVSDMMDTIKWDLELSEQPTDWQARVSQLVQEVENERHARNNLDVALRNKDQAMQKLFDLLAKNNVDYSHLLP